MRAFAPTTTAWKVNCTPSALLHRQEFGTEVYCSKEEEEKLANDERRR